MRFTFLFAILAGSILAAHAPAAIIINEIDYDQPGTDTAEFIELAANAGTNLNGWTLELVNGADNLVYSTIALPNFTFTDQTGGGWGFFVLGRSTVANMNYDLLVDGSIQNGAPDGARLIDPGANVTQFVSYEGTMPGANDIVPTGILDDNVLAGTSIYKTGTGSDYADFTWAYGPPNTITPGALNPGQSLVPEPATLSLAVITASLLFRRRR